MFIEYNHTVMSDHQLLFRETIWLSMLTLCWCFSDLDLSTVSLPAYSVNSPDASPSQFTRSFSRSSGKRRSKRGSSSSNNSACEIPEVSCLLFLITFMYIISLRCVLLLLSFYIVLYGIFFGLICFFVCATWAMVSYLN